jgi:MoxR-like ATPase
MFETAGLNKLYQQRRATFAKAAKVGDALNLRFYDMKDAVDCLLIAAISGESVVMIGPPGTAKSRLVRAFCNLLGIVPDAALRTGGGHGGHSAAYFEYLLTQFTEPSELFGFYDIAALQKGTLVRMDDGMMQKAKVVFLDEVFNASSAILNALLTFMNERRFHDRGKVVTTELGLLVAASNQTPTEPGLAAVYDRFLLRCRVANTAREAVKQVELIDLLTSAWSETHAPSGERDPSWSTLLDDFAQYRSDVDEMTATGALKIDPAHPTFADLTQLVASMVKYELSAMSNRRLVKMVGLVLAMRMLRAARSGEDQIVIRPEDLDVILRFSLDREDPSGQARVLQELGRF